MRMDSTKSFIFGLIFACVIAQPVFAEHSICDWLTSLVLKIKVYIPKWDYTKSSRDTREKLEREMRELEEKASVYNGEVKQRFLKRIHDKVQPVIKRDEACLHYLAPETRDEIRLRITESEYKKGLEDSFVVEGDVSSSQALSFFCAADEKCTTMETQSVLYKKLFSTFEQHGSYPILSEVQDPAGQALFKHVKFCRDQLEKIHLGLNIDHVPSISSSTYRLCVAIHAFRHKDKAACNAQAYINAHTELAEAAFACVDKIFSENEKSGIVTDLRNLGLDEQILQKAGFSITPISVLKPHNKTCNIV